MKQAITNLFKLFKPKGYNELYGKNGFNKIDRVEIRRDDARKAINITMEFFSETNPKAKGAPNMLLFNLEDAKAFHKALGQALNPSKKDLEDAA